MGAIPVQGSDHRLVFWWTEYQLFCLCFRAYVWSCYKGVGSFRSGAGNAWQPASAVPRRSPALSPASFCSGIFGIVREQFDNRPSVAVGFEFRSTLDEFASAKFFTVKILYLVTYRFISTIVK